MPPLVCVPIALLDQSFPRDKRMLQSVGHALGKIEQQRHNGDITLLFTDQLAGFAEGYDWAFSDDYSILATIYTLISQWVFRADFTGTNGIIKVSLSGVEADSPHPVPSGSISTKLLSSWALEMGKLLKKHDQTCERNQYFIGIACDSAYAGHEKNTYENPENRRAFPLVGPNDIDTLGDAYLRVVHPGIENKLVRLKDVLRNFKFIGASRVQKPKGDSHYKMDGPWKRPWTFDVNVDPIPDEWIKELEEITGFTKLIIKNALIEGIPPGEMERQPRLSN